MLAAKPDSFAHNTVFAVFLLSSINLASAATLEEALSLTPIQSNVEYARPANADVARCSIQAEKFGDGTAWFVRDPEGQILRRFADSNSDNVVDQWSYFLDGLEVYRDIDSNFNKSADQYRWFHTAGTRWGIDDDEDERIDRWRRISAQEVAEELVLALRTKNAQRFSILLPTEREIHVLGLGASQTKDLRAYVKSAADKFKDIVSGQKVVSADTRYVDFGASRPATIPAGTGGSTEDLTVYENVSALVENGGKHEQVFLGTMIAIDEGWRLVDAPTFEGSEAEKFSLISAESRGPGADYANNRPTEQMAKLMDRLQQLDARAGQIPVEQQGSLTRQRTELLLQLAAATSDPEIQTQWFQQLADMLSHAIQAGGYDEGFSQLEALEDKLQRSQADDDIVAYVRFRKMLASYIQSQQTPQADLVKIGEKWLADLENFVQDFPHSPDAAEAKLQLGMSHEFSGEVEQAQQWYQRIVKGFPSTSYSEKAAGALRRLGSEGKSFTLRGSGFDRGRVDLSSYRGKVVLVLYWASWVPGLKEDTAQIKDLYVKNARRGFEIIGVCLDDDLGQAKKFLAEVKVPWKHIYESGGLNNRLANEMGVMTLPVMILVDPRGVVVNRNVLAAELDKELQQLLK